MCHTVERDGDDERSKLFVERATSTRPNLVSAATEKIAFVVCQVAMIHCTLKS